MPSRPTKFALGALALLGTGVLVKSQRARSTVAGVAGGRWRVRLPGGGYEQPIYDDIDEALAQAVMVGGSVVTWPLRVVVSDFGGYELMEDPRA